MLMLLLLACLYAVLVPAIAHAMQAFALVFCCTLAAVNNTVFEALTNM
jgi:hypothetical protein